MTKTEKLLQLLQPKEYVSKIKLYCLEKKVENLAQKFGSIINKPYVCKIKIIEM